MKAELTAVSLMLVSLLGHAGAEEFVQPKSYPISRYEIGWKKNPFTLKTAPVALQKANFANDLTLAGIRQSGADTTVILANKKTREYFRLKNAEPSTSGIKVKAAHPLGKRSETYVELENGTETAIVRYDESYLQQIAAQNNNPMPVAQANVKMPAQPRPVTPWTGANPSNISPWSVPSPNIIPQQPIPPVPILPVPPLPAGVAGADSPPSIPTPVRRRLLTAPKSDP